MRRVATISAAKMALCVINIIPPAWAQDRPDVVDRSTEDTNHHVSQQTTWPQFRGHLGRSVSRASNIPLEWSSDNVMWRASTPSFGQSSPVIWNDTVFLTSIEGASKETLWISALHLTDGRNFDLFMIHEDGTHLEQITYDETFDGFPMFSPDGRSLVFASNRNAETDGDTNVFIADWNE